MDPVKLKALKIKTGVVKRCGKEKTSYRKEAEQQKVKVEKMVAEKKDECEIKKMNECVAESLMMIPNCHRQLEKYYGELKVMVDNLAEDVDPEILEGSTDYKNAKAALTEADEHLKNN